MSGAINNEINDLLKFGGCCLDTGKRGLWCEGKPVNLPLKSLELLCLLERRGGQVVTKEEIWQTVWPEAFVEETNLTHNIYLLRKALKEVGEADLIETVPRRGYRFASEVRMLENTTLILEKRTFHQTNIHIEEETNEDSPIAIAPARRLLPGLVTAPRVALMAVLRPFAERKNYGYAMMGRIPIHANLGEKEAALRILNESGQTRDARLPRLNYDPRLKVLRSDPRFQEIMHKMYLLN